MRKRTGRNGLRAATVAAAALALAGCAADYVGDDWQCPLAQGSVCASVAAADPAVPESPGPGIPAPRMLPPPAESPGKPACATECGPLAWLAGLLGEPGGDAGSGETAPPAEIAASGRLARDGAGQRENLPLSTAASGTPATGAAEPAAVGGGTAEPETSGAAGAALASDASPLPGRDDGPDGGPRAPETIARVWIAPWVDAHGIYREGAWVRAVIAPAEWRLR